MENHNSTAYTPLDWYLRKYQDTFNVNIIEAPKYAQPCGNCKICLMQMLYIPVGDLELNTIKRLYQKARPIMILYPIFDIRVLDENFNEFKASATRIRQVSQGNCLLRLHQSTSRVLFMFALGCVAGSVNVRPVDIVDICRVSGYLYLKNAMHIADRVKLKVESLFYERLITAFIDSTPKTTNFFRIEQVFRYARRLGTYMGEPAYD